MIRDIMSVFYAYGVFMLVYLANILFSLYLNIEVLDERFDKSRIYKSARKAVILVVATALLVIALDTCVSYFASFVPELSAELEGTVSVMAVMVTIGRASLLYLVEAYATFKKIIEEVAK